MISRFFRSMIKGYTYIVSPLLGQNCRYFPTCSSYADEAFERHGVLKGLVLSILRISRCHPWSRAPFIDPVPKQFTWRDMLGYKRSIQETQNDQKTNNNTVMQNNNEKQ